MNRILKSIGAAVLAAAMCVSLAGCGDSGTQPTEGDSGKQISTTTSKPVSAQNSKPAQESTPPEEPKEFKFVVTDEIKNATLESGLIQINNDIFQQGGYITVADFFEKYKDRYDIAYSRSMAFSPDETLIPYEEAAKDRMLQSREVIDGRWIENLKLTPKEGVGDTSRVIYAEIQNRTTTGDDEIPLPEGIVMSYCLTRTTTYKVAVSSSPYIFPMGWPGSNNIDDSEAAGVVTLSKNELDKFLADNGFTQYQDGIFALPGKERDHKYAVSNVYYIFIAGEPNLFGRTPLFCYETFFDNNDEIYRVEIGINYID